MPYTSHKSWVYSWPMATAAILAIQVIRWFRLGEARAFTASSMIGYFLLIMLAAGIASLNAVRSRQAIRLFWAFLAASFALWAISTWVWIYYLVWLRASTQNPSMTDPPLFLHIVLVMAAVAVRPHLKPSAQKPYQVTVDFLLLLYFWVFVYAYIQLPYPHTNSELQFILLYSPANAVLLVLLVFLGLLNSPAHSPWKSMYWSPVWSIGFVCSCFARLEPRSQNPWPPWGFLRNPADRRYVLVRLDHHTGPKAGAQA